MNFDATHPIWTIAKAVVLLGFAALFAYTNADNFDGTEIKMLIEIAVVLFGSAALETFLGKKK